MVRPIADIVADIERFEPVDENWLDLEELVAELFTLPSLSSAEVLLRVFERYPTDDGAGVFWSILHGIESLPGYESLLIDSLRRRPSEFALIMVNRLLNSEIETVGTDRLTTVLEQVGLNESAPFEIRSQALKFLARRDGN
jgi:hypothetical protein